MSAIVSVAAVALAGVSMVAADGAPCLTLVDAVQQNGLGALGGAVLSVVGDEAAQGLAALAQSTLELPEDEKVTIFAPEDAAFPPPEMLPEGSDLVNLLLEHVSSEYLPSDAIFTALATAESVAVPTLTGSELTATEEDGAIFVAAADQELPAMVITADIETCSGVIHIIDSLLLAGDSTESAATAPAPAPTADAPAPSDVASRDYDFVDTETEEEGDIETTESAGAFSVSVLTASVAAAAGVAMML